MTGGGDRRLRRAVVVAVAVTACGAAGCTRDQVADRPTTVAATAVTPVTTGGAAEVATSTAAPPPTTPAPTTTTAAPPTSSPATTGPVVDTGVPGLDSDDAFCAAWSRFGGSWQVVLAASAFAADPADPPRLEVLASTVVGDAYEAMFAVWPTELADEQALVADAYFGAFERRSADALAALLVAGADESDLDRLAEVWVDALARRSPSDPVITVDVPDDLVDVAAAAGATFAEQRVPFTQDPSMVITAETPLTDAYLASACPDQGSIVGGDVVG